MSVVYVSPIESKRHVYGSYYTTPSTIYKVVGIDDFDHYPIGKIED